jgi:hypothetical protein
MRPSLMRMAHANSKPRSQRRNERNHVLTSLQPCIWTQRWFGMPVSLDNCLEAALVPACATSRRRTVHLRGVVHAQEELGSIDVGANEWDRHVCEEARILPMDASHRMVVIRLRFGCAELLPLYGIQDGGESHMLAFIRGCLKAFMPQIQQLSSPSYLWRIQR